MEAIDDFSVLKQVQSFVIKYANVISNVLNADIEIVDNGLRRVAGTGIYSGLIDRECEGISYKYVMNTGKYRIIEDPTTDYLCTYCEFKDKCGEKLEIATPIVYDEKIVGVIGLVCFSEEKKDEILKNVDDTLKFLKNIAELISSKIYEEFGHKNKENIFSTLNHLIKNVSNPIVILDDKNNICSLNYSALTKLSLENFKYNFEEKVLWNTEKNLQVFDIKKYEDYGIELPLDIGSYKKLFIFNNSNAIVNLEDKEKSEKVGVERIVGESTSIKEMKRKIQKVASSSSTVLITGESGTGKELVARALHEEGDRNDKPFIAINCAAIPEALLESELFGYSKGAFSGADSHGRMGKFELANSGVMFLDEIGDMPIHLQAKILRVLQDRKCVRVGSNKLIDLDLKIVAATNKDLRKLVEENKFREDLYYRLNVIPIEIPALKDRENDIKILIENLISKYEKKLMKKVVDIDSEAMEKMLAYSWPGNIRELENCVEYMINLLDNDGIIKFSFLPNIIKNYDSDRLSKLLEKEIPLKDVENIYIKFMINKYGNDLKGKKIVAEKLKIGIATLYRKLEKLENEGLVN